MGAEDLQNRAENEKLSAALGEIFSNPDMLSAISSMAQKLKNSDKADIPSESNEAKTEEKAEEKAESKTPSQDGLGAMADKLPDIMNMLSGKGNDPAQRRRSDLLCALKPYLSQSRCDAIDRMIRISELSNVFKTLS